MAQKVTERTSWIKKRWQEMSAQIMSLMLINMVLNVAHH